MKTGFSTHFPTVSIRHIQSVSIPYFPPPLPLFIPTSPFHSIPPPLFPDPVNDRLVSNIGSPILPTFIGSRDGGGQIKSIFPIPHFSPLPLFFQATTPFPNMCRENSEYSNCSKKYLFKSFLVCVLDGCIFLGRKTTLSVNQNASATKKNIWWYLHYPYFSCHQ